MSCLTLMSLALVVQVARNTPKFDQASGEMAQLFWGTNSQRISSAFVRITAIGLFWLCTFLFDFTARLGRLVKYFTARQRAEVVTTSA